MVSKIRNKEKFVSLAIVVGTALQERITRSILPGFNETSRIGSPTIISLENFYQFRIDLTGYTRVIRMKSPISRPWYDRRPILKIVSLPHYLWRIFLLSRKFRYFIFYTDTGILDRSAIVLLKLIGRHSIVVQEALKLPLLSGNKRALLWFGSGNADHYLLIGDRYIPLIQKGNVIVTGSPVLNGNVKPLPPGNRILVVNQTPARYGYITEDMEFSLIQEVVDRASQYGDVELRLHPHNNAARYEKLNSPVVEVSVNKPLFDSISESGIVLCIRSTVILEAISYGRPVLVLDWFPSNYQNTIRKGTTSCKSIDEMCDALKVWKENHTVPMTSMEEIQRELKSFVAYSGEDSVKRITKAIESIIKEGEKI
ncbi:MAG: hypothetical protein R6X10_10550 [Desulfobacterales bacterium]